LNLFAQKYSRYTSYIKIHSAYIYGIWREKNLSILLAVNGALWAAYWRMGDVIYIYQRPKSN